MRAPAFGPSNPESRGKIREADAFGYPKWEESLRKGVKTKEGAQDLSVYQTYRTFKEGSYVPYKDSLAFVEKAYPFDPGNPQKPFAKELRIEIADRLGLETAEDMARLRFYSALNSPLDRFHGVDAFISFTDKEVGEVRITLDETENQAKIGEEAKADILMNGIVTTPEDGEKKFFESVNHWADEIAKVLERKREQMKRSKSRNRLN